jgi:hypothetical protein
MNQVGRKRTLYNGPPFAEVSVQDNTPLSGVHRAIYALDGVRQAIVEDDKAVELWLDRIIKIATSRSASEMVAKQVSLVPDQGFAPDRAARVTC